MQLYTLASSSEMPDVESPGEESLSKATLIQCSKCDSFWHTSCAGLNGITTAAIIKLNPWHCYLCYELPLKIKEKTSIKSDLKEIQEQMEKTLKALITKTIQEELERKLTEEIDVRVKECLNKLLSTEEFEGKLVEKMNKSQLLNVSQEIEEKVNQKIRDMPPVPATEGSEENNIKIDKVIKDHQEEKEKLDEERLKEKKEKQFNDL